MVARVARDAEVLKELPGGEASSLLGASMTETVRQLVQYRRDAAIRAASRKRIALLVVLLVGVVASGILLFFYFKDAQNSEGSSLAGALAGLFAATAGVLSGMIAYSGALRSSRDLKQLEAEQHVRKARLTALSHAQERMAAIYKEQPIPLGANRRELDRLEREFDALRQQLRESL